MKNLRKSVYIALSKHPGHDNQGIHNPHKKGLRGAIEHAANYIAGRAAKMPKENYQEQYAARLESMRLKRDDARKSEKLYLV